MKAKVKSKVVPAYYIFRRYDDSHVSQLFCEFTENLDLIVTGAIIDYFLVNIAKEAIRSSLSEVTIQGYGPFDCPVTLTVSKDRPEWYMAT
jgi:hypothetical protein